MRSAVRRTVITGLVTLGGLLAAGSATAGVGASGDPTGPASAATTTTTVAPAASAPVATAVPRATDGPLVTADPEHARAVPDAGATTTTTTTIVPPAAPPSTVTIVVLDGVVDLRVRARGRNVAPRRAGARSSASLVLRLHEDRACVGGYLHGVADPTGVALHRGMYRQVGDVVLDLSGALTGPGCVALSSALRAEILAAPAAFYLQVTSERFPAGAVRGQLAA